MTLLGTLAKRNNPLENPEISISDPALVDWLESATATKAGVSITENRAYGLTAYLRAIALMSGTMAATPIHTYQKSDRSRVVQKTVLDDPNPAQTPFEFWQTTYANAIGWGSGYARKVRNKAGIVAQLWPRHPSRVRIEPVDPGTQYPDGKRFWVRNNQGIEVSASSYDIMHLPYLALDGVQGLSPLRIARESLGVAVAAEDYSSKFYSNGAHMSGVLASDDELNEDLIKRIKRRWQTKMAGLDNAHEVAVIDGGLKWTPISINPADAQLLESRKFGVVEVARITGVPPHLLMDVEKSTSWGTGIEQQNIGLVTYTLRSWYTMVEQRVTREALPGGWSSGSWFAEYDLAGLLRGDNQSRAQFYSLMIQWGIMTRNEARKLENLPEIEGLDEPLTPSNMTLVNVDGNFIPLAGAEAAAA